MIRRRFWATFLILAAVIVGYFVYSTENSGSKWKFKLGLDLAGGTELVYKPDLSKSTSTTGNIVDSMDTLRDVIERRVNLFGVSEPVVRVDRVGLTGAENENRLTVELP